MTKKNRKIPSKIFNKIIFLILIVGFTSCNGQLKKDLPKEKESESKMILAEHPTFIKTQNSHSGDNVNGSIQDQSGHLWFSTTSEGVYKYDGKSFIQYPTKDGLNSNGIHCIFEDQEGKIWIGTDAGVCVFDGKTFTELIIPLPLSMPANKISNKHNVFHIIQDQSDKIWFATIDGVFIYENKSFKHFIVNEGERGYLSSNNNVEYILEDNVGNLWFGGRGNKGVFRYDGKTLTNLQPDGDNWAWPLLQEKNGTIWFSNWEGAYHYDGKSFVKNDHLSDGPITRIIEDKKSNLWFGGGNRGICRFDRKSYSCFTIKDGLINNSIWTILEDKIGNIWIGSRNTNLSLYDGKTFINFSE